MSKLHAHTDGEAVKGVHQADSEGQIAYLSKVWMYHQQASRSACTIPILWQQTRADFITRVISGGT